MITRERLQEIINESLRDWFKKEDWVRIDTQGNITGECGTTKKGKATTRCLPRKKAQSLSKKERAATSRKKVAGSKKVYDKLPKEFFYMRELLLSALWRSPEKWGQQPE